MRRSLLITALLVSSLTLVSCAPSRDDADKKLAKVCLASIKGLSDPDDQFDVQKTTFLSGKSHDGLDTRTVTLNTHFIHAHGVMVEKDYSCTYKEQWSMFGYMPEFYNLEKDGQKIGNVNGSIQGDTDSIMKINNATEQSF